MIEYVVMSGYFSCIGYFDGHKATLTARARSEAVVFFTSVDDSNDDITTEKKTIDR